MKIVKTSAFEQLRLSPDEDVQPSKLTKPSEPFDHPSGVNDVRMPLFEKPSRFVVLGPGTDTFIYNWGDGNMMQWREVMDMASSYLHGGGFQRSDTDILLNNNDVIIDIRGDDYSWGRTRSKYAPAVMRMVRELLRRNLIQSNARILIGNCQYSRRTRSAILPQPQRSCRVSAPR